MRQQVEVVARLPSDESWVVGLLRERWGSTKVVSRGVLHDASRLPGFVAVLDGLNAGLLTYRIDRDECEVVTLDAVVENVGVGTSLLDAVQRLVADNTCRRVWLITTNDNLHALRFYQRRGFRLAGVYPGAVDESRRLKPEIPLIGAEGIPIRDEIELELRL
ncbi:MAG TPA: GNAT family N-acetyltransferase [Dehalococcoidia bacterium]|nr:GNAT family N-acetyltransferase [Dehalococcoidia bacterium]